MISHPLEMDIRPIRKVAIIAAALGLLLFGFGALSNPEQMLRSLFVGWMYWVGISLGSLAALMLHNLTGGAWGMATRRVFEAGTATIPIMGLLFIPFALHLEELYPWARPDLVASDPLLQHKQRYLNVEFFNQRTAFYFVMWTLMAWHVGRRLRKLVDDPTPETARKCRLASARGLFVFFLMMTFAAIDWGMSLEPHWFSAMYGLILLVGNGLAGLAFATATALWLTRGVSADESFSRKQLVDLGNLMLAFTMLWAYMSFMQFLIIWYADLPEEVPYYLKRIEGGWVFIAAGLAAFHFFLPFLVLFSRRVKERPKALMGVGMFLLVVRWFEQLWLIEPAFEHPNGFVPWLDLLATVAIGGIWLTVFSLRFERNGWLASVRVEGGH